MAQSVSGFVRPSVPNSPLKTILFRLLSGCVLLVQATYGALPVENLTPKELAQGYRDHRILAKPRSSRRAAADLDEARHHLRLRRRFSRFDDLRILDVPAGNQVDTAIAALRATGNYEYVERDLLRHAHAVPNDSAFDEQWALRNTGQTNGTSGADIGATTAWNTLNDASSVIVAVIDTGIRQAHADLAANLWSSPAGTHGINATVSATSSGYTNPEDDSSVGHGTHVAGIIGAVGNNGVGISGVAWKTKLMGLKFLPASGSGSSSDAIECIDFAIANHANIINASFGGGGFSSSEFDAFKRARDAGIIVVASAGNDKANSDVTADYPAGFALDNIVSVGASTHNDVIDPTYSNFGSGSVDLVAPGTSILSLSNSSNTGYATLSGTSMSAPYVSGALALLKARFPNDSYRQLINRLLRSTTKLASLSGKVQTGGRLNLAQALTSADNRPFNDDFSTRATLVGPNVRVRSSNFGATAETEPAHAGFTASRSLWWTWTASETTQVFFDTAGSSYDTVLALYTGASLNALTPVASNDDSDGAKTSRIVLNVIAGTTYQIAVDSKDGGAGYAGMRIGAVPVNDDFSNAKTLAGVSVRESSTTLNASRQSGEPNPTGNAAGHSVWYKWTAPSAGTYSLSAFATSTDTIAAVYTGSSVGTLTTIASNDNNGNSLNSDALATFTAVAGQTYYFQIDHSSVSSEPEGGDFTLTLADSVWEFPVLDEVTSSPAVGSDGTIYFGVGAGADKANDTRVIAVTRSGARKWSFTTSSSSLGVVGASPAIGSDGTVYIGSYDKSLYALNGSTGVKVWSFTADTSIISTPALGTDGTIYFRDNTKLYALTSTGTLKWSYTLNTLLAAGTYGSPVVGTDNVIYVGTTDGALFAFIDNGTGTAVKWTFTADGDIYTTPAIGSDGTLYFGTLAGSFYALTPGTSSATKKWSIALPKYNGANNSITSSPALASDGTIYFAAYDHKLYALSGMTGQTKWTYTLGNEVRASSPAIAADGTVFVGAYDGSVYAISAGGSLVRSYASALPIRSSPVIADNRLYFGSADAKLHAFNVGQSAAITAWPMFHQNSARTGRAVAGLVSIATQPQSRNVVTGTSFSLTVAATSGSALTYQWFKDGSAIAGATSATYSIATAAAAHAGSYTVNVTGSGGTVTSSAAQITVSATNPGRLVNLSVRANAGAADQTLIAGFVIAGAGEKEVLVRGVGPTLQQYGVSQAVSDPRLTLKKADGSVVGLNDNWTAGLGSIFGNVGASALLANSQDAALVASVTGGAYTAQVETDFAGIALAEVFDTNPDGGPRLANLSGRAPITTSQGALIAGFVISGQADKTVLIRGVGPKLTASGVSGAIANPKLELFRSGIDEPIYRNDDWESGATSAGTMNATFSAVGAFSLDSGSRDAALLVTLPPGVYSAQVTGVNGSAGVALVELYEVP